MVKLRLSLKALWNIRLGGCSKAIRNDSVLIATKCETPSRKSLSPGAELISTITLKRRKILHQLDNIKAEVQLYLSVLKYFDDSSLTASNFEWFNRDTTSDHFFIGTLSNAIHFVLLQSFLFSFMQSKKND